MKKPFESCAPVARLRGVPVSARRRGSSDEGPRPAPDLGPGLVPAREKREELLDGAPRLGRRRAGAPSPRLLRDPGRAFRGPGDAPRATAPDARRSSSSTERGQLGANGGRRRCARSTAATTSCFPTCAATARAAATSSRYGFLEKDDLGEHDRLRARSALGAEPLPAGSPRHARRARPSPSSSPPDATTSRALWLESPYADPWPRWRSTTWLSRRGSRRACSGLTSRVAVRTRGRAGPPRARPRTLPTPGSRRSIPSRRWAASARPSASSTARRTSSFRRVSPRARGRPARRAARSGAAPNAGHCHHDDEPARVATAEYDRRWREFFRPPPSGSSDVIGDW